MSSKLSMDVLSIIFEDLEHENGNTLYSCIFVNREWCQVAVPFLWKNPWKKFHNLDTRSNRYKILFKCFLMIMPRESKEFLKMKGINLLIEDTPSQNNSPLLRTPLFNYASFCKVIDSININNMIYYNLEYLTANYRYLVEQEILKLLIANTSKLQLLMLYKSYPIVNFPNSSISLSQLNELHCNTSIDAAIFYGLSQLCRNIERLVIEGCNDDNSGLISFIKQQINLKRVKIWKELNLFMDLAQGQCKKLGEALVAKASNIIELDIGECCGITIPPILLKKFQNNLTIFKFGFDHNWNEVGLVNELENILRDISLPNLQQLIVYRDCSHDIIANIVEKTNGELKKINVETNYNFNESDLLSSTIAKHCPKLELLAMWVGYNLSGLLELIKECKKLRGLVLRSYNQKQNIGKLFKLLYNNASNQLRKLQLDGNWELSKEVLNEFFENWAQQQRNSLDFYISYYGYRFEDDYEDIIKKYQELGVIRKFENNYDRFNEFYDSWG